jgi:hypothetical protein
VSRFRFRAGLQDRLYGPISPKVTGLMDRYFGSSWNDWGGRPAKSDGDSEKRGRTIGTGLGGTAEEMEMAPAVRAGSPWAGTPLCTGDQGSFGEEGPRNPPASPNQSRTSMVSPVE